MPGLGPLPSSDLLVLHTGQTQSEDRDHDMIHMMIDTDQINTGGESMAEKGGKRGSGGFNTRYLAHCI